MASYSNKIICFSHSGLKYGNNTKCPTSDSCCQTLEQCRPDRLCTDNTNPRVLVRALCANHPWTNATCSTLCPYDNENGVLPRVKLCNNGSYCCDNDPTCCKDHDGVFLDGYGAIITSTQTTSSTTTSLPSSFPATTSPSSATKDRDPGLSQSAEVGVGVGVGVGSAAIIAIILALFFWRRKNRTESYEPPEVAQMLPHELEANPGQRREPVELE